MEAYQSGNEDGMMESAEAAEALMNIDSSTPFALDEKQLRKCLYRGTDFRLVPVNFVRSGTSVTTRRRNLGKYISF